MILQNAFCGDHRPSGRLSFLCVVFLSALSIVTVCAEEARESALPAAQVADIRSRIDALQAKQADYHRKVTSGEITPGDDLRKQWPQLQEQLTALHQQITALNSLDAASPQTPGARDQLFRKLQQIGIHLEAASHPPFTPRILDAADIAEMRRIEDAIVALEYGDRGAAVPLRSLSPDPCFTLIHLPVPIVLQSRPGDTIFLASTTGGAFENGLSLIELKADEQGIARTTWISIGDAVGDCDITVHSASAIETRYLRIKVISPALVVPEGLPQPAHLEGELPRLKSKLTTAKGQATQLTE